MLKLLLLREKKAGHINQVEGLAAMFAELTECAVARLDVRPVWWAHVAVRNHYLRCIGTDERAKIRDAVRTVYGIDIDALEKPDIVIGSGRPTTALLIWLKRYFGCKAVFSGHASGPARETIDLQLVNSPRSVESERCVVSPVPGRIDAADYPPPKPIRTPEDLRGASLALIIGGNAHSHTFAEDDWSRMLALTRDLKAKYGVRWRATNSRRSPDDLSPKLDALVAEGVLDEFVDFKKAGLSSAKALFGSDLLVVTEDSLSMVSEGFAAGRTVVALRPQRTKKSEFTETIAYQCGQGWLASLATADADAFAAAACALRLPDWTVKDFVKRHLATLLP